MGKPFLGILVTSYNDGPLIKRCLRSVYEQKYERMIIVCVDDGSDLPVKDQIDFAYDPGRLIVERVDRLERCGARAYGLKILHNKYVDYFIFLDSDMAMPPGTAEKLMDYSVRSGYDGVVVPELAFSHHENFWTKVKVFERNIYQINCKVTGTSIEAARLWKMDSFPGFMDDLNAFEEIQPTIKFMESGGKVEKISGVYLMHDEKFVSLKALLRKKTGYFTCMSGHEAVNLREIVKRFYFFRPHLYKTENLLSFLRHPVLFAGVVALYFTQTMLAIASFVRRRSFAYDERSNTLLQ
ncbi:MAG: glycosyltransferase family 2 protein [Eubacteriales bacterium]